MCKSYPERQLQKFVERLCTTTICKNRKHEKEFAKSAKNFSQRNLQKDCLEQQFAKILSRTTICQKWLSGMTICTKIFLEQLFAQNDPLQQFAKTLS